MVEGLNIVFTKTSLSNLHFPLTCESYLPALAMGSCGDVPLCLWALSAQANDLLNCLLTRPAGS